MRKAASLVLSLSLLASCSQVFPDGEKPPVNPPTNTTPIEFPNASLDLGYELSKVKEQALPTDVKWQVMGLPSWLTVSAQSGSGPIKLTVTANRTPGTPSLAQQPQLQGSIRIMAFKDDQQTEAVWTVTANQYALSGKVGSVKPQQLTGQDAGQPVALQQNAAEGESRGIIVKYRQPLGQSLSAQSVTSQRSQEILRGLSVNVGQLQHLGPQTVRVPMQANARALQALRADPNVEYAVPNRVLHAQAVTPVVPTDEYAPLQWAYRALGYGSVWRDIEAGGYKTPVTVAVADSGVRYDHPDLAGKLYTPKEGALDFLESETNGDGDGIDTDPTDPMSPYRSSSNMNSHGTHVSGIIVARWGKNPQPCPGCSDSGVVGASYKAPITVLPLRVIDVQGNTDVAQVLAAVRYAAGISVVLDQKTYTNPHPAKVINLSLGGPISAEEAKPMCEAVADAKAKGALVVVAAGNNGGTAPYYPAACDGAVAVGSVSFDETLGMTHQGYSASYSQVQLAAPGGADVYTNPQYFNGSTLRGEPYPDVIFSTDWDYEKNQPNYNGHSGTSQAAPQVSALAALLLSKGVTTGPDDTLQRMMKTATDLGPAGRDPQSGFGMINPVAALGTPAVQQPLLLIQQAEGGRKYLPPVVNNAFKAYLPDGKFTVLFGNDANANGLFDAGERPQERSVVLGPQKTSVDLGTLLP